MKKQKKEYQIIRITKADYLKIRRMAGIRNLAINEVVSLLLTKN